MNLIKIKTMSKMALLNNKGEGNEEARINPFEYYTVMILSFLMISTSITFYIYSNFYVKEVLIEKNLSEKQNNQMKIVCYYNVPTNDSKDLIPSYIDPHLCTHINVAFLSLLNKTIQIDDNYDNVIKNVLKLKEHNENLKVLISVGGAGTGGFSEMVLNHDSRKIFIKSLKYVLKEYKLDGVDLDWEFPVVHKSQINKSRERQHFSQLLQEIKKEFIREKRNYILTVALAAQEVIVRQAYDVTFINNFIDFANIMTYDYHFFTKETAFTGLNAPLYKRSVDMLYMSTLNINYTTNMYLDLGLDREKIVIGIPTFGHSFTLRNSNNGNIGSPSAGYGSTGQQGFVCLPDVCSFLHKSVPQASVHYDNESHVPYIHKDYEWISYENLQSVKQKALYIKQNNFGGAMIYSLNCDDYLGHCSVNNSIMFPLTKSVQKLLTN